MMHLVSTRGAVAALLAFAGAAAANAQTPVPTRVPDTGSVHVRLLATGHQVSMDSIAMLLRAFEQEPLGSQALATIRTQIDRLVHEAMAEHAMFGEGFPRAIKMAAFQKGWIGINAPLFGSQSFTPAGITVEYLDYQPIVSVDPESPAQRAGVLPGDVLIAYNGVDLRNHRFNLTQILAPEQHVVLTIRRDGETREFPMVVAKAPQQVALRRVELDAAPMGDVRVNAFVSGDAAPRIPFSGAVIAMPPNGSTFVFRSGSQDGVFGARVIALRPELARALKLESGLLVDEVPDESPAFKSGLRTGDVIVSASGQPVGSLRKLLELLMLHDADRSANLVVMRDSKARKLIVTW